MNKSIKILLSFLLFFSLVGCDGFYGNSGFKHWYGFSTAEIVVDVTPETKSFRIEVECTYDTSGHPPIYIDRENTTAKHNTHFVNTPEGDMHIGAFTPILDGKRAYKDIEIKPENITEKVVIAYYIPYINNEREDLNLIKELKVILQLKTSN